MAGTRIAATHSHEQEWARLGASTRLMQLRHEIAAILRRYPELRRASAPVGFGLRPRRRVSAAARKAMSDGMRRFWARRRAAHKG